MRINPCSGPLARSVLDEEADFLVYTAPPLGGQLGALGYTPDGIGFHITLLRQPYLVSTPHEVRSILGEHVQELPVRARITGVERFGPREDLAALTLEGEDLHAWRQRLALHLLIAGSFSNIVFFDRYRPHIVAGPVDDRMERLGGLVGTEFPIDTIYLREKEDGRWSGPVPFTHG